MKQNIREIVEIPEGVTIEIHGKTLTAKSGDKQIDKDLDFSNINAFVEEGKLVLESKNATKKVSKMLYTIKAHANNMVKGLTEGFEYKLEIAFSHFPMTVEVNGQQLVIKNFLGEKKNRSTEITPNVDVSVNGNQITVSSHDKEVAGQMAANIEKATHIKNKDRRKFQDGIYITEKPGRVI